jgi:hypothetical protein
MENQIWLKNLYKNKVLKNVEEMWTLESNANNPNTRRGYGLRLGHFLYSTIPHFLCDGRRKLTKQSDLKKITTSVQNFSDDGKTVGYFNQQDGRAGFNIWCATQVVAFKPPLNRYWDIPKCFDENPGCILEDFTAIGHMLKLGCTFVKLGGKLGGRKWSVSKKKKRGKKKRCGGTKSLLRPSKGIKGSNDDMKNISFLHTSNFLNLSTIIPELVFKEAIMKITDTPPWASHNKLIKEYIKTNKVSYQ